MAPKTAPELEADAHVGGQSPGELLDLMRAGLTFNGVRVLSLRVELADGTIQRLQMPAPQRAAKDWTKTRTGRAILDAMAGEIEFILAKRRNGTTGNARGRFFGSYQAVRS